MDAKVEFKNIGCSFNLNSCKMRRDVRKLQKDSLLSNFSSHVVFGQQKILGKICSLMIDQCLKFLESSRICLLTFNLIVFEQMKRFVFPANFGFSAFLLGRDKIMWGHWWLYFNVNERL